MDLLSSVTVYKYGEQTCHLRWLVFSDDTVLSYEAFNITSPGKHYFVIRETTTTVQKPTAVVLHRCNTLFGEFTTV